MLQAHPSVSEQAVAGLEGERGCKEGTPRRVPFSTTKIQSHILDLGPGKSRAGPGKSQDYARMDLRGQTGYRLSEALSRGVVCSQAIFGDQLVRGLMYQQYIGIVCIVSSPRAWAVLAARDTFRM